MFQCLIPNALKGEGWCLDLLPAAIDKLTEQSQVSEDGTMVTVPKRDAPPAPRPDHAAVTGTSDTESNSGRDTEVRRFQCPSVAFPSCACVSVNRRSVFDLPRMCSTPRQRWRDAVCPVPPLFRTGPLRQTGSVDMLTDVIRLTLPSSCRGDDGRPGSPAASPFCPPGSLLEVQAPAANHHATAASPGPPGGKDLHRQVRKHHP